MARLRRLPVASGVCAGLVLLIFSNALADTTKDPPTIPDKLRLSVPSETTQASKVLPSEASSSERIIDAVSPLPNGEQADVPIEDLDKLERKQSSNVRSASIGEKVPTAGSGGTEAQGIRSRERLDGSLTSDTAYNASRFEGALYGSSGKSSSTKTIAEDPHRLFRTNGLSTVTTKPSPEESAIRQEDKRNRTSHREEEDNNTGERTIEATTAKLSSQPAQEKEREASTNTQRSLPLRLEPWSKPIASSSLRKEENLEKGDREATTPKGILQEDHPASEQVTATESKSSEALDLARTETKKAGEPISLINDTYVNYSPYYKSSTAKDLEAGNGTNFISEESGVSHGRPHPKEEVEVVGNVTQPPIQGIVVEQQASEHGGARSERNETASGIGVTNKQEILEGNIGQAEGSRENVETSGGGKPGKSEEGQPAETATSRANEEEQTVSAPESNQSPVPRGRTIAFSGANEFPSLETKTTAASTKEIDAPASKKNTSTDKTLEQKPYPYLKSTKEPATEGSPKINTQALENTTTEESSAYENTIVRDDSEKKMIVTEPSVVIENSIQQFRPAYKEKSESEPPNNSTVRTQASVSTATTLIPSEEVRPTNGTLIDGASNEPRAIATRPEEKPTSGHGNDVPRGSEGREAIKPKDESFDVTGNGITEVSPKPESPGSRRSSYEPPFRAANGTTEEPLITDSPLRTEAKMGSNVDVQTDAEESLLIRSTLNATEVSTEYPLTREAQSEGQKMSTSGPTSNSTTIAVENTTVMPPSIVNSSSEVSTTTDSARLPESPDTNGTNEIPSGTSVATPRPDDTSASTTTAVEYEFVGLSEAMAPASQNVTEGVLGGDTTEVPTKATSTPMIPDSSTKDYSVEDATTTVPIVTVTDGPSSMETTEITTVYDVPTTLATDEILTAGTIPPTTTEPRVEDSSTVSPITENQTGRSMTTAATDSTTTMDEIATVTDTENPLGSPVPKDPRVTNVTEISSVTVTSTSHPDVTTTMSAENVETSTPVPFVPSSLRPRMFDSSTPGEVTPSEDPTDVTRNLSPDEITSLVRIVIKGTWYDVCPHLDDLRSKLAELLRTGMNKSVHTKQVIIHQNPCLEPPSSTPAPTDMPVMSILVYVVDENGKFDSAMTNMLPTLYNTSNISFPVTIHSFLLVQEKDSGNAIAVVVVSSVAFICLVLLAGLLFIMRKRQTRFNYGERCRPVSLDAYSLDSVSAYNSVRRKGAARSSKRSYGNPTFEDSSAIPSHPLNFAGLSSFCNDVNAINEEFGGIPQVSAKIDELPPGAEVKNRYANVIPLPETRVPLQKTNNDPLSEYINASYVRGPRNATRYYIACQAPMESTVTDFWRMIWEQQSKVIIMLTDLVENDVEKCTEYIPPSEVTDCHRLYGDFQVTLKKRETKEKYAISTLQLKNLENNTFREVYHIWYLWPVNGVQSDGAGLIAVILEARALQRGGPGPIVVHCSPGTGRTGTLIALDLGIRQFEITRTVDVPRVVYTIRRDRAGAVQTKEQYAFIYKALNLYATKLAGGVLEST